MTEPHVYADWNGIEHATKEVAKRRRAADSSASLELDQMLLQARFDRFLCRVFMGSQPDGRWLLKGGTALLARVPNARSTRDVDLSSSADSLDEAVADLAARVEVDLGDHLRFTPVRSRPTGGGQTQPFVAARSVTFAAWDGPRRVGDISVDIVVGHPPTGSPEALVPATRIELPRPLPTVPFQVYPLVDHVADKVCATMTPGFRDGIRSTRVKDLVDLVVIAESQAIDLRHLRYAIATERIRRHITPFDRLDVPAEWRVPFAKLATMTHAVDLDFDEAIRLMDRFITPALAEAPRDGTWAMGRWAQQ